MNQKNRRCNRVSTVIVALETRSTIRKNGNRFSEKIMRKQSDEIMMRLSLIAP